MTQANKTTNYAVSSIVCALASWIILGWVFAPLGIIFGCMSLSKNEENRGLAIAGIIIGTAALAVMIMSAIIISMATSYR